MNDFVSVAPGQTASITVAGNGMREISISISGAAALGNQPFELAVVEYFQNDEQISETFTIGGGFAPSTVNVMVGAPGDWTGSVNVTAIATNRLPPAPLTPLAHPVVAVNALSAPPYYTIGIAGGVASALPRDLSEINGAAIGLLDHLVDSARPDARFESIVGNPGDPRYLGEIYSTVPAAKDYVDSYVSGDLRAAAKVLVTGYNGDLIYRDTGFYPDGILRKQAGYEGGTPSASYGGPLADERRGDGADRSPSSGGTRVDAGALADERREGPLSSGTSYRAPTPVIDSKTGQKPDDPKYVGAQPILLDLDNTGVRITELSHSPIFMDAGGDGLLHRTAWAGTGDGVLFFDPDGRNAITEQRQYVFTEWDPTAKDDLAAVRAVFDSNGDGKLTSADTDFAKFKVLVTNADGTATVKTLAQLGITEINLTADTTRIELPDGSVITGQTTFKYSSGATGTVANTTLVAEAQGHRVVQTTSTDGSGNTVVVSTGYAADGSVAFALKSVTSPTGSSITNTYDDSLLDDLRPRRCHPSRRRGGGRWGGRVGCGVGRQRGGWVSAGSWCGGEDGRLGRMGPQSGARLQRWVGTNPTAC